MDAALELVQISEKISTISWILKLDGLPLDVSTCGCRFLNEFIVPFAVTQYLSSHRLCLHILPRLISIGIINSLGYGSSKCIQRLLWVNTSCLPNFIPIESEARSCYMVFILVVYLSTSIYSPSVYLFCKLSHWFRC